MDKDGKIRLILKLAGIYKTTDMNFFRKIFGTKDSPTPETKVSVNIKVNADIKPVINEINVPVDKPKTPDFKVELSSVSRITGLDNEFIDLIYFANPAE